MTTNAERNFALKTAVEIKPSINQPAKYRNMFTNQLLYAAFSFGILLVY
jgi:hypothetical protein